MGAVTLTTDIWTSRRTQAFITVTAHFMSPAWELMSCVLETPRIAEAHTAANIAVILAEVMENWRIRDKVVAIVTDNASNMVAAIEQLKIRHMPCFAHTLNLVVTDTLAAVTGFQATRKKVKDIVSFFHHSVKGSDVLAKVLEQAGSQPLKLINEVETRWNSCHDMLKRYNDLHPQVTTALCLVGRETMLITQSEVEVIQAVIAALGPFEEVTREMSSEKMTTVSKVIPLIRVLQDILKDLTNRPCIGGSVAKELLQQLNRRFASPETKYLWAASTYLDPRFKKHAFSDGSALQAMQDRLKGQLRPVEEEETSTAEVEPTPVAADNSSIWTRFDSKISSFLQTTSTPGVRPNLEMRRYAEENPISRKQDPLEWWRKHSSLMPQLQEIAKKFLCCPATSVPSERVFSATGELVSHRRSNLTEENVNMIIFLNKNTFL
ncbi:zinc finger BED domain-containing protein 4-like [Aplysia californica]|uniref:Zinc finger BED domain-containing protein 4-like n=1 Tax=Aplysia californica TaxID=6500 RepID=A0ABM0K7J5_APLCA|nr:zinc finger BED domain-containing protein 4-like [Aplysia californica]